MHDNGYASDSIGRTTATLNMPSTWPKDGTLWTGK
jgi:hypothetical protein